MTATVYAQPDAQAIIRLALHEDLAFQGDATCRCLVPPGARLRGTVTAKQAGLLCGLPLFAEVCRALGGGVRFAEVADDGTRVTAGTVVLRCEGAASVLLQAERTFLNLAQRLSGVATLASRCAAAVAGTRAAVFDTRKTTPGLRALQKHAVVVGGCRNHRYGLHDQVLIKENHIALMSPGGDGSRPAEAVRRCRAALGPAAIVEVEIEDLRDLEPVMAAGASIILLDNMDVPLLQEAVARRGNRAVELEASGGITLDDLSAVAATGVDRISLGALTHSAPSFDLSLRCEAG
jgi:nicotinate-nucleotide pyrophosphorylase (carboxylating)